MSTTTSPLGGGSMPDAQLRHSDVLLLLRAIALVLMLVVLTRTQADPDLWGHVLFGRDIVSQRAVPRVDHYAFTSDRPWIDHEWLSEAAMYGVYALFGAGGLSGLKVALVSGVIGLVLWSLRKYPMPPAPHDLLLFLTIAGVAPLTNHIRPEMFSLLLFSALTVLLLEAAQGRGLALLIVPLLMLLWTNVHGGWVVGMGVLGVWAAVESFHPRRTWAERMQLAGVLVMAVVSTLVNPYGYHLWTFITETVGLARPDISEWLPVYRLGPGMVVLWTLITTVAVTAIIGSHRTLRPSSGAVVAMLGFATFRVSRLIGFFVVSVVILLAPQVASTWQRFRQGSTKPPQRPSLVATTLVFLVAAGVVSVGAVTLYRNLWCVQMEEDWSPEPAAAQFITSNRLHGRMLTWFDWGEYAIWHFSPSVQVSMDGRRETVYTEAVRTKHLRFFFNAQGGRDYATELNSDYIWVPARLPIVPVLLTQGWVAVFQGPISVLLGRPGSGPRQTVSKHVQGARCFPGP